MKFLNREQTKWMNKVIEIYDSQDMNSTFNFTKENMSKLKFILKREMYDNQEGSDDMIVINSVKSWYRMIKQLQKIKE